MSRCETGPRVALTTVLLLTSALALADAPGLGVGHAPTAEDLRKLSIMITTDGAGLPPGSGTAVQGKEVFKARCASCHGATGDGADGPSLVGGQGTLATPKPKKTVGSYWPYATTLWDYVNRAMPFNEPGTLTHDEVYAASAYVLFLNGIVSEQQVLNARTLARIKMPNRGGFVPDPRPDVGK